MEFLVTVTLPIPRVVKFNVHPGAIVVLKVPDPVVVIVNELEGLNKTVAN